MESKQQVLNGIISQGLLPLFFHEDPNTSLEVVKTLYSAGIRYIEYTNRGKEALSNFRFIKAHLEDFPDLKLGIGTIKNQKEADEFIEVGTDFIISPIVKKEVATAAHQAGLLWIPGCFSPTEIYTARSYGASLVKIFPANILGPQFISAVKELFPGQFYMPTGGVEIEDGNIKTWFNAGVSAVGMGSKLITKDILENKDYQELYNLTIKAIKLVEQGRN